jgi:hypothetical protein
VAPIDEAKETSTTPHSRPKTAPPASVIKAAPGSDSHDDVCGKVEGNTEAGIVGPVGLDGLLLRLECLQVEVLAQVQCQVQADD